MKRTIISRVAAFAGLVLMLMSAIAAQDTPNMINGGTLNGKATSLPAPEYPEPARSAKVGASIVVNVVIDETGSVISAEAEINDRTQRRDAEGRPMDFLPADPTLREAAENAARHAKFAQTLLNGQPVRIKGDLVYHFRDGVAMAAPAPPKTITGGVLNAKATSMPKPEYPAAAIAVRAEGAVSVQITIDESGNVIAAAAVSGHPLLRSAAEDAARNATFSRTLLSGQPVKVSGIVTYNFVLPKEGDK